MALVTKPATFSPGQVIIASDHNSNFDVLYNLVNGGLETVNLSPTLNLPDTYLAQVTTANKVSGTALSSLSLIPAAAGIIPEANLPAATGITNYRSEMIVEYASTTTLTSGPGTLDVNGIVSKTAATTLTLTTAGDWAGGVSLRATTTVGYVGIDEDGNIKLHTTAPAYSDYDLTITAGKRRYASWSGTVYRITGWFYMNSTGSGEIDTYGISNLNEHGIRNEVMYETGAVATGTTAIPDDDTIPTSSEGDQYMSQVFVPTSSTSKVRVTVTALLASTGAPRIDGCLFRDSTTAAISVGSIIANTTPFGPVALTFSHKESSNAITLTTFKFRAGTSAGATTTFNGLSSSRKFGGVLASSLRIEEIE